MLKSKIEIALALCFCLVLPGCVEVTQGPKKAFPKVVIHGQIVDAETGGPVGSATVEFYQPEVDPESFWQDLLATTVSDATGGFRAIVRKDDCDFWRSTRDKLALPSILVRKEGYLVERILSPEAKITASNSKELRISPLLIEVTPESKGSEEDASER